MRSFRPMPFEVLGKCGREPGSRKLELWNSWLQELLGTEDAQREQYLKYQIPELKERPWKPDMKEDRMEGSGWSSCTSSWSVRMT